MKVIWNNWNHLLILIQASELWIPQFFNQHFRAFNHVLIETLGEGLRIVWARDRFNFQLSTNDKINFHGFPLLRFTTVSIRHFRPCLKKFTPTWCHWSLIVATFQIWVHDSEYSKPRIEKMASFFC
jgi:hypothetical protein